MKTGHKNFIVLLLVLQVFFLGCDRKSERGGFPDADKKSRGAGVTLKNLGKIPTFTLHSALDDTLVSSNTFRDRVVFVAFFTPWCSSCFTEMAMLQKLQNEYNTDQFSVVGLAIADKNTDGSVERFIKKLNLNFPVLLSNEEVRQGFGGIISVPTAFLIDTKGTIVQKYISELDKDDLSAQIEVLLKEPQD